jgi:hypothetical protein
MTRSLRAWVVAAVTALIAVGGVAEAVPASAPAPAASVSAGGDRAVRPTLPRQPVVTGPTGGTVRAEKPFGTTMAPLEKDWVEEEFFFEGKAKAYDVAAPVPELPYKTRILVRRPTDPKAFNGTVVLDWNNVTLGFDKDVAWLPMHPTMMKRGYVSVSVAAQYCSIHCSPLALKQYDPLRYGSLNHPGDNYSFDIFSQAAEAVLDPKVLGKLRPGLERRLAVGASQSAIRLKTYINKVHREARVYDGFGPQIIDSAGVDRSVAPTLWLNSTGEATTPVPADSRLFRLWELAGPGHTSYGSDRYQDAVLTNAATGGRAGAYDHEDALAWGYQRQPGSCQTANYSVSGYAWSAALVALDTWVRTGKAPKPQPRVARNANGSRKFDAHGNILGGVRMPLMEAPIASYFAGFNVAPTETDPCGVAGGAAYLKGTTRIFDAPTLKELYPTPQAYLKKFDAGLQRAVAAGIVLPEGAPDLERRSRIAAKWVAAATG